MDCHRNSDAACPGASTGYRYDDVSRLSQLSHDFAGTAHDLILDFAYNPASQIVGRTASNSAYAWTGHGSGSTASTADGLNRLAGHGGATPTYDARGNITYDGTFSYAYSSENLLTSFSTSGPLEYDPLMRFYKNYTTTFVHDGPTGQFLGEYYNGNIVGRYVPGPDTDEALAVIDKFGNRTWLHADERGSVIASSGATGANSRVVQFDEYGKRGSGGSLRFAYTGQFHLLGDVYDYKNRNYNARLGRFLQTDPIGYGGGMNPYIYVGGDPVNFTDPSGLCGFGQFPLATPRTNRPPGDVVALYFFTCMELFSEDGPSGGDVGGNEGVPGIPIGPITICPPTTFVITGVGPQQANSSQRTSISQQPGNKIDAGGGGVAIKPGNFGVTDARGARREVFRDVTFFPIWESANDPAGAVPAIPEGLPSRGPYRAIDVISPPSVRNASGNHIDLYRYSSQRDAFASTRRVLVVTVIPSNTEGVSCPVPQ